MWLCHENQALKNSYCFIWSLYGWKSCFLCWNKGLASTAKKAAFFVSQQHSHEPSQDKSIIKSRHCGVQEQFHDKSTMKTQVLPQGKLTGFNARRNYCLTSMSLPCGKKLSASTLLCFAIRIALTYPKDKKNKTSLSSENKLKHKMWIMSNRNYSESTELPICNLYCSMYIVQ